MTRWQSARHDLQVVADEQVAEAALALEPAQEVDDLRLHREVERRGRLVEQDELRLERDGAGDRDALALAAGEFVREARGDGVGQAGVAQRRLTRWYALAGVAADAVDDQPLLDDLAAPTCAG